MSVPETEPQRRFVLPAEYYSGPTPEAVLPRGITYGCGAAGVLALILMFAGGAFLASGGMASLMDLMFGMTMGDIRGRFTSDVTDAQKSALESEIETLRQNLREENVSVPQLEPVLQKIRKASSDGKISGDETEQIAAAAAKVNRATARKP